MIKIQHTYRNIQVAVVAGFILCLLPGAIHAQAPLNVDWAGGGVFYDREASRSIRYNERSRKRSRELRSYGSVRYSRDTSAMLSYDSPQTSLDLEQQTLTALPEGARELKVSDDMTYYVVDGQYYWKAIEGGTVKYIAVSKP